MKQCIILVFCCIILSNVYSSAAENGNSDLAITTISYDDIGISWSKSSFSDADSYKIEVNTTGDNGGYCSKDNRTPCTGDACEIKLTVIGCNNIALPCYDVIMTVTGNGVDHEPEIISTTVAPYFPDGNWNLGASINGSDLTFTWGPLTGDYVSCATNAMITATCGDRDVNRTIDSLNPISDLETTQILSLDGCPGGSVTDVTVTYLSKDVPTETKKTYGGDDITYIAVPDAPAVTNVVGKDTSPTTLSVTWEKPTTPIGAEDVTGYTITASPGGTSVEVDDPDAVTYELTGLLACLDYTVSVAAKWSGGTGESGSNTGTTGSQAPGKPSNVKSESTKREISVSWNTPNSIDSCPITSYTVTWTPGNGSGTTADETPSYTITGLTRDTEYTIDVNANAGDKPSSASDPNLRKTINLYGGDIAGIVCGCLVGVALIIGGIFFGYKKKKLQKEETNKA